MNLVGKVNGVTYMLPFYNYSMGIIYRKDLLDDPKEQAAFKAKYGIDLKMPDDLGRISRSRSSSSPATPTATARSTSSAPSTRASAATASACSGRTISTPMAASITTRNWKATFNSEAGIKAVEDFKSDIAKHGPTGCRELLLRRGLQRLRPGQGLQLRHLQHPAPASTIPAQSAVVGKAEIAPNPGGGLNGGWGWAIPNSSPNKDAAWTFIKWVELPEIVKKRTLAGGAPTQAGVFDDPECVAKRALHPAQAEDPGRDARRNSRSSPTPSSSSRCWGASSTSRSPARRDPKEALRPRSEEFRRAGREGRQAVARSERRCGAGAGLGRADPPRRRVAP